MKCRISVAVISLPERVRAQQDTRQVVVMTYINNFLPTCTTRRNAWKQKHPLPLQSLPDETFNHALKPIDPWLDLYSAAARFLDTASVPARKERGRGGGAPRSDGSRKQHTRHTRENITRQPKALKTSNHPESVHAHTAAVTHEILVTRAWTCGPSWGVTAVISAQTVPRHCPSTRSALRAQGRGS